MRDSQNTAQTLTESLKYFLKYRDQTVVIKYGGNAMIDEKVKEIRQMDGTPAEKQAIFDTLDRNRTRAHNGVISLFNDLNDYATEHGIAQPYPTTQPFDKSNVIDRGKVADILAMHETILETTNLVLESEKRVKSEAERLRTMSLSEQLEFAKSRVLTATDLPDDQQPSLLA